MSDFRRRIRPYVTAELSAANRTELRGNFSKSFRYLERAHVLAQSSTREHVRVHWRMLLWAIKRRSPREIAGQIVRIVGAASKTELGLVPLGNTGGSNVSPFRRMPIPQDLTSILAMTRPPVIRKRIAALCAALSLLALMAFDAAPTPSSTALVGGHHVAFRVIGSGRPAIVMISGLGDGMATFEDVARDLGKNTTVIVYDRAGYGASDAGSWPRDAVAAERELSGVLEQSGVEGPYVLAGHSLGGLFAEYYAAKHPDQVAGLVLEDSRPADFTRRCMEASNAGMCVPPSWLVWFMAKGARGEATALTRTTVEVGNVTPLTGMPVLVLSRSNEAAANSPFDALWIKAQADLAARYSGSLHLTAPAGGHYVHRDQPDWFLESVRTFLSRLPQQRIAQSVRRAGL